MIAGLQGPCLRVPLSPHQSHHLATQGPQSSAGRSNWRPPSATMPLSLEQSNWAVCAALAAPHLLYAYIWFFPRQWQAIFKKRSVEAFETLAWLLKSERGGPHHGWSPSLLLPATFPPSPIRDAVVQFLGVAYWYLLRKPAGLDLAAVPLAAWPVGLGLAAFGQVRVLACDLVPACVAGSSVLHAAETHGLHHAPAAAVPPACAPCPPLRRHPPPTLPSHPPTASAPITAQWLNVGIFQAIGHAGVYYGFKLGHTIPWVDGFPFNVVRGGTHRCVWAVLCGVSVDGAGSWGVHGWRQMRLPCATHTHTPHPHAGPAPAVRGQCGDRAGRRCAGEPARLADAAGGALPCPALPCSAAGAATDRPPPGVIVPPAGVEPGACGPGPASWLLDGAVRSHRLPGKQAAPGLSGGAEVAAQRGATAGVARAGLPCVARVADSSRVHCVTGQ